MKHKRVKGRLFFAIVILILAAAGIWAAIALNTDGGSVQTGNEKKETIYLWYTDDSLTDYLNSKALEYYNQTDVRVMTELVSGLEYLEAISKASLSDDENTPDVYIVSNDSLEKAYLAGLAYSLGDEGLSLELDDYSQAALNAVTYKGKYVACPLYFETSALLYNKTYLEQIAEDANSGAMDMGEDAEDGAQAETEIETVSADDLIPSSVVEILTIANLYSVPENVEYFFRWDVSDIFYNYFFIGNYISVGGEAGDDEDNIDIYNEESIASLEVYQELNQFFSIEAKETSYDTVMQDFIDGKTIYTIATSDCIARLDEAAANGEFDYEYGIAPLPDINSELETKGMSVTYALAVNGYSEHKDAAAGLIELLASADQDDMYDRTGKLSAREKASYDDEHIEGYVQSYAQSVPMPKMLEASNFWVELEICFSKVWSGEDANAQLKSLSEQIKTQISGESVTEETIADPDVELMPDTDSVE